MFHKQKLAPLNKKYEPIMSPIAKHYVLACHKQFQQIILSEFECIIGYADRGHQEGPRVRSQITILQFFDHLQGRNWLLT